MYADSFSCQNFPGSCSSYVFYAVDVALKTWQQHIHKQQLSQQEIILTLPAAQPTASKHCNFRLSYTDTYLCPKSAFSALTLLAGWQEGQPASKKKLEWWGAGMVICLERDADLHMAQLLPLPLTVSCFSKIQIGFTFLVLARPGKKGSPYSITKRRVPELIPVLGSQPVGDVSHKPGGRLPLLSASHPRNT